MPITFPGVRYGLPLLAVLMVHALFLSLLGHGSLRGREGARTLTVELQGPAAQSTTASATSSVSRPEAVRSPTPPAVPTPPEHTAPRTLPALRVPAGTPVPAAAKPAGEGDVVATAPAAASAAAPPASGSSTAGSASSAAAATALAATSPATPAPVPSGDALGVLTPPRLPAVLKEPPYPQASRWEREQGRVTLRLSVRADGSVASAQVLGSSGFARLDRAARDVALRWRLTPARRNGSAVEGTLDTTLEFRLEN